MTEGSSHGSNRLQWPNYLVTFLGLGLSYTPHSLVNFKAVVSRQLLDSQVQLCVVQDVVGNLVGDSWSTGACTFRG